MSYYLYAYESTTLYPLLLYGNVKIENEKNKFNFYI